jgi:CMP/dCMP kinase
MDNVICIDGPAASGKSTIANLISQRLNIPYINTGNMYRAVTSVLLNSGLDLNNLSAKSVQPILNKLKLDYKKGLNGDYTLFIDKAVAGSEIRIPEVTSFVSNVAALPAVRDWLMDKQRSMSDIGLILMEGRDIGTVIFPNAKYKFFLTATPLVRAKRRLGQSGETVDGATVESVAQDIAARDEQDKKRSVAPLIQADDAILVDSSDMTIEQVIEFILDKVKAV